jgi:hypothetical protein
MTAIALPRPLALFHSRRIMSSVVGLAVAFTLLVNPLAMGLVHAATPPAKPAEPVSGWGWIGAGLGALGGAGIGAVFGSAASGIGAGTLIGVLAPFLPWIIGGAIVGAGIALLFQAAHNFAVDLNRDRTRDLERSGAGSILNETVPEASGQ